MFSLNGIFNRIIIMEKKQKYAVEPSELCIGSKYGNLSRSATGTHEMTFQRLCETGSNLCSADWICYCNEDYACFAMLGIGNGQVNVRLSVSVSKILQVQVFENGKIALLPSFISDNSSVKTRDKMVALLDLVQKSYKHPENLHKEIVDEQPLLKGESNFCSEENSGGFLSSDEYLNSFRRTRVKIEQNAEETRPDSILDNQPFVKIERLDEEEVLTKTLKKRKRKSELKRQERKKRVRNEETPYICYRCDRSFALREKLLKHLTTSHEKEDPSKCNVCGKTFGIRSSLWAHRKYVHTNERSFVCDVCDKSFKDPRHLKRHSESHKKPVRTRLHEGFYAIVDGPTPFKCSECDNSYSFKCSIYNHYRNQHARKDFECKDCGKSFATRSDLKEHAIMHEDKFPHRCDLCEKTFKRRSTLWRHSRYVHTNERPYVCGRCDKSFKHPAELAKHSNVYKCRRLIDEIASMSTDVVPTCDSVRFRCDECDKLYSSKFALRKHRRVHHSTVREFKCRYCDKTCATNSDLKDHVVGMHADGCSFQCDVCGKGFRWRATLYAHMRYAHTDERPYVCERCGRSFKEPSELKRHGRAGSCGGSPPPSRARLATKAFACTRCDKSFPGRAKLHDHAATHDDARPFGCDVCGKFFKRGKTLSRHKKNVHADKKGGGSVCRPCGKTFKDPTEFARHLRVRCCSIEEKTDSVSTNEIPNACERSTSQQVLSVAHLKTYAAFAASLDGI